MTKNKNWQNISASTVAACSTGLPGAISVIRISGEKTKSLLEKCFFSKEEIKHRFVRTGKITADDLFDTAMAVFFKAPDSYTGEDMAEISVHANPIMVQKILLFLIKNGAQPAQRGEFTYRAFLNNKMDLSAAEAVVDIINAESESEIKYAYRQMKGELRQKIDSVQTEIAEILAGLDAAIDFPEENIEAETISNVEKKLEIIKKEVEKLLNSYKSGKFIKSGVKAAIVGGVNVGKSSLLNALLKKERAIVTDIPGTTRDTLEDRFEHKGQKFIITDTAGIRKSSDIIEEAGIERSKKAAEESDVIIAVTEAGRAFDKQIQEILEKMKKDGKKIVIIENKADILTATRKDSIALSAKTGQNINKLKDEIYRITIEAEKTGVQVDSLADLTDKKIERKTVSADQTAEGETVTITDLRHYRCLLKADEFLSQAQTAVKNGLTMDLVAADFLSVYNQLGCITGISGADLIIETVFSRFCVGK